MRPPCHRGDHGGRSAVVDRRGMGVRRPRRRSSPTTPPATSPRGTAAATDVVELGSVRLKPATEVRGQQPARRPGRHAMVAAGRGVLVWPGACSLSTARVSRGRRATARRGTRVQRGFSGAAAQHVGFGLTLETGRGRSSAREAAAGWAPAPRGAGSDADVRPDLGPQPHRLEHVPHRMVGHRRQVLRLRRRRGAAGRVAARGYRHPDAPDGQRLHRGWSHREDRLARPDAPRLRHLRHLRVERQGRADPRAVWGTLTADGRRTPPGPRWCSRRARATRATPDASWSATSRSAPVARSRAPAHAFPVPRDAQHQRCARHAEPRPRRSHLRHRHHRAESRRGPHAGEGRERQGHVLQPGPRHGPFPVQPRRPRLRDVHEPRRRSHVSPRARTSSPCAVSTRSATSDRQVA